MKKLINVLLVDDHKSTIDAYSNLLNQYEITNPNYTIKVLTAACCDSTIKIINNMHHNNKEVIDVSLIDMRLPKSKNGNYSSGEDLCLLLKKMFPKIKIIIITGHYETLILSNVLQNVNPDAMLLKGDIQREIIFDALTKVLNNEPYYSISVLNLLRKKISSNISIEPIDKLMLYELWKGTKTKDLVYYLPLSIGAIEKRKRNLRLKFNTNPKDDNMLIKLILEKGFL
ncbi:response regulator transcription factor [Winogradskyella undariae]|uniref:response regulator n=1 Tax=Winogradskyella undariae TaxID=1285465 RepID=UPI00156A9F50|nr:response regulator [Winogradskyella undariae]NRR91376.1 response regulator transcription factor [Winogradskyella undariae]